MDLGPSESAGDAEFRRHVELAERGDREAMFYVAECYSDGISISRNLRAAFVWYERAGNHGMIDAMYEVARCYCEGVGVCQDLESAKQWLEEAYGADHLTNIPFRRAKTRSQQLLQLMVTFEKRSARENFGEVW